MTDVINKEKILEHAKQLAAEGKLERAIEEYRRLLQINPNDLRIKIKIAELYVKRRQIQEAVRLYTEVAKGYTEGGFYLKAATVYKNILRLNPSLVDVNTALSELYEKMGLAQDALHQYQIVATALEQKSDVQGVLNIREKMSSLDPANISLKIRLAEAYQLYGQTGKSIDVYEGLAEQLKNSKDTDQLIEIYNKILSHRSERTDLLKLLCRMYYKRGEWKDVLKKMELAKEFVAEDPELLGMQADVYARLNQTESAKGRYRDLAVMLNNQGNVDGAIAVYENILFLSPEDEASVAEDVEVLKKGTFLKVKANVEARRKKMEEAAREIDSGAVITAEVAMPGHEVGKADSAYDLGMMYKKMGLEAEAASEFSKALKIYQHLSAGGNGSERITARISELESPAVKKTQTPKSEEPVKTNKKKISFV